MHDDVSAGLDLSRVSVYQSRRFVPEGADLADPATVVALFRKLVEREVDSAADYQKLLLDRSELDAAVDQVGSVLYIRMTCQTDDEARAKAYREFIENVVPAIKPVANELDRRTVALRERVDVDARRYEVHDRNMRVDVELFRDENVPLETQESLLSQEYQTVCGAMTVEFDGKERTLPEMGKFLHEPDRPLRERAWRAIASRRLQDRAKLDGIFDRMLPLRVRIAGNSGFDRYVDYRFREYHRFDYTPADCRAYHDAVERAVVPLWRKVLQKRREMMKLDALRPWDTAVDPMGRPPLKPFEKTEELVDGAARIFHRVDGELGRQFDEMKRLGLLDLASRKGKAPGGYQSTLSEVRKPFIFMNAVGLDRDVTTLLHEGGHAFHALAAADDPLFVYRHAPMEFCEVASMGMELLAGDHLDVFYNADDLKRSRREHLEGIVFILPWVATIDAFQQWIYEHPGHTVDERRDAWRRTLSRFDGVVVDWSGLDEERGWLWHRQLHIFEVPFYYIEYGIAQLGALQLWVKARKDPKAALAGYKRALALGGSRPLPELFEAAGLKFDFSEKTIAPLVKAVEEELEKL